MTKLGRAGPRGWDYKQSEPRSSFSLVVPVSKISRAAVKAEFHTCRSPENTWWPNWLLCQNKHSARRPASSRLCVIVRLVAEHLSLHRAENLLHYISVN